MRCASKTSILILACMLFTRLWAEDAPPDLSILTNAGTPFIDTDRLMCLGDSITQFGDSPKGYVTLLRNAFTKAGHPAVAVLNAGVGGNRVPNVQERLDREITTKNPTVAFIYIGINDVWHNGGNLGAPKTQYETGLREIIGKLQSKGIIVVLATPTVIGEKPDGTNPLDHALDVFSETARAIAKETNVEFCDLRKAFIDYLKINNKEGKEKGILTVDGVHLSSAGDALVAQEAAKSLVAGLPRGAVMPMVMGGDFVGRTTVSVGFHASPEEKDLVAHVTVDGSEPTLQSPVYSQPLVLTETTTVKVRAFKGDTPVGSTISSVCAKLPVRPADPKVDVVPGLAYAYYEESMNRLPDFSKLTPAAKGMVARPDLSPKKRDENYALHFTGYIQVPAAGLYQFSLASDDGSRFLIGNQIVVDADGVHAMGTLQGRIALQAGMHACTIDYFQGGGGAGLELSWSGPNLADQPVPAAVFFTAKP